MDMNIPTKLKTSISFKQYLLGNDIQTRHHILEMCIKYMESSDDHMTAQVIAWLRNLQTINDTLDAKERKEQIRLDACWDELHISLLNSKNFYEMIKLFS